METTKECPWCGDTFTPDHGNNSYCSNSCKDAAKADRQKAKRDPIKGFIPIMMSNHEQIDAMFTQGITEPSVNQIEAFKIDLSLCRYMKPPHEHDGKLMLDFGEYYLITEPNFLTFKIYKHDTAPTV